MKRIGSPLSAILLAVILAVTSLGMATARGQARSIDGTVVLCTGQGAVTVAVDANGTPVGPAHICPDCVLGFFALAADLADMPERALARGSEPVFADVQPLTAAPRSVAQARGPPAQA